MKITTEEIISKLKILLLDVDGILTSGLVNIMDDGREIYTFNVYDGYGIKLWRRAGFKVGFVTGRCADAVKHRADKLGVDFLCRGASDKVSICEEIVSNEGLTMQQVSFMGDDLQDLPIMKRVGFPITVANARDEVKNISRLVTSSKGGDGAVREAIEFILKEKGLWDEIVSQDRILS